MINKTFKIEIKSVIAEMKTNRGKGPNGIHIKIWVFMYKNGVDWLTILYNYTTKFRV